MGQGCGQQPAARRAKWTTHPTWLHRKLTAFLMVVDGRHTDREILEENRRFSNEMLHKLYKRQEKKEKEMLKGIH